jgi:acetolactate synthase-1/2/3 large subunit
MCRCHSRSSAHGDAAGCRDVPGSRGRFHGGVSLFRRTCRTAGQSTWRALLDSGDVVITIGYDAVEYWPSLWNKDKNRAIVHIDVTPAKIENDYSPAVELIGSIEETLAALSTLLERPRLATVSANLLQLIAHDRERLMAEASAKSGIPIHPMRLISELQKILTPDVTV